MVNENIKKFCKIVKQRSDENETAIKLLIENQLYGKAVETLRTELDSFVRVIYLQHQTIENRNELLNNFFEYKKWDGATDRTMVNFCSKNIFGWEQYVYKIGCGFIHLSVLHNYDEINPFDHITNPEKSYIKNYLNSYHNFPLDQELNMNSIIPYLEKIFLKIRDSLLYQVDELKKNKSEYSF